MCDRVTVRLENKQTDGLEAMTENGDADNDSEALRTALNIGLGELGYLKGHSDNKDTQLRAWAQRFADAFGLMGLMWVGVTLFLPVGFRVYAIGWFAASLACIAVDRGLAALEPQVSRRLNGIATSLLGGDKA